MRLLVRLPERVAVIDAEQATPDVKATLLTLDAFTIKGSRVVHVVRQSALLQGAVQRQAFHSCALASVIWHEMAHSEGADEREARRREQSLWTTFVRDQRVDDVTALRYLEALANGPTVSASPPCHRKRSSTLVPSVLKTGRVFTFRIQSAARRPAKRSASHGSGWCSRTAVRF